MKTNLNGKPISEVNDLNTRSCINLRPDYQRGPVWSFKNKVYLIDTILQGLPIPKFFIQIKVDRTSGKTIYDVVDGQQRLTAIFEFINGKTADGKDFILSKKYHPKPESFPDKFEGISFKMLNDEMQLQFWHYKLSFEELEDATEQDIKDMFIRLNLGGAKLNPQELRNAAYNGDFKVLAYELADDTLDFYIQNKIISPSQAKRMTDAELTSELLAAMMNGLQDKKKKLDKIYADYDTLEEDVIDKTRKEFKSIISLIDKILDEDIQTTRFNNKNDFYSLFYALYTLVYLRNYKIKKEAYEQIKQTLIELHRQIRLDSPDIEMLKYYEGAVNAGDTKSNREFRHNVLVDAIEPYCIPRDKKRLFTTFEKKFLWHSSTEKKCNVCNTTIASYDDYEIDHIVAWDMGGETNLSNAQLTHKSCNRAKSNK